MSRSKERLLEQLAENDTHSISNVNGDPLISFTTEGTAGIRIDLKRGVAYIEMTEAERLANWLLDAASR
jgi:hypothetical protein